jgi:hypothetical protein
VDARTRKEVAEALVAALAGGYAHAEVGQRMAAVVRKKLRTGAYDKINSAEEFAHVLTADVRAIVDDKHLRVMFAGHGEALMGPSGSSPMVMMAMMRAMNGAVARVQILEGNIGYMEVNGEAPLDAAKDPIAAAFAFLRNTNALIIDARGNAGGDPQTVAFYMSYLSAGAPYVVNRIHWREGNRIEETLSTDVGPLTYGAKKPVFYLTSSRTFSGGEEFAYDLQAFKRGVIVGETTGGGANPSDLRQLGHGFSMRLPGGYAVNPVTDSNWEGVGVSPDVNVPAAQALIEAQRLAVDRLLTNTEDPRQRAALAALAVELKDSASADDASISSQPNRLRDAQSVGQYRVGMGLGPSVSKISGKLYVNLNSPNTPEVGLLPEGGDRYRLEGYPDDFTAAFSQTKGDEIQLKVYLSRWPATIAYKQEIPIRQNP